MADESKNVNGVEVVGTLKTDVLFQTLAAIISSKKKYGVELSLKSCEKAEKWTSIVHRTQKKPERDSA